MQRIIYPAQVCNLVILKKGIIKLEESKLNPENPENSNLKKIGLSLLNFGISKIINSNYINFSQNKKFWNLLTEKLNYKIFKENLKFFLKDSENIYFEICEEIENFLEISDIHQFILQTVEILTIPLKIGKTIRKGNILDLFARKIFCKIGNMDFMEINNLFQKFKNFINNSPKENDIYFFLDNNFFFIIEDYIRDIYEKNKNGDITDLHKKINSLEIHDLFKKSLKDLNKRNNSNYISTLFLIKKKNDNFSKLSKFNKKFHFFIDNKIIQYFPRFLKNKTQKTINSISPQNEPDLIQKAVLLKAFLNLLRGNLEEAEICFNDSIRFGQINKDTETINSGLIYLIIIYGIKEKNLEKSKKLKDFFSLNLNNKNPILIFYACLYYLDLDKEYDENLKKVENLHIIENCFYSIKKIIKFLQDSFFDGKLKYFANKNNLYKFQELMNLKFLEIFQDYNKNFKKVIFAEIDFSSQLTFFYKQLVLFKHFIFLTEENIENIFEIFQNLHFSYLKLNQNHRDFFFFYLGSLFEIRKENYDTAQDYFEKSQNISKNFIDPYYKHSLDYLKCLIFLKKKKFDDLKICLNLKLKQLKKLSYSKNLYFKFLSLKIQFFAEIQNHNKIGEIIRNNLNFIKKHNLYKYYHLFLIYEAKIFSENGNLEESLYKFKKINFVILRTNTNLNMIYNYEYALCIMRLLKKNNDLKNDKICYFKKKARNLILIALEESLKILDFRIIKNCLFFLSAHARFEDNDFLKEDFAKKVLQIELLQVKLIKNKLILARSRNLYSDLIIYEKRIFGIVKDILE